MSISDFITGSLNKCSSKFNWRALLCQMNPRDYSSYRGKLQPERVSLLCLWLRAPVSQEKGMWYLNTWDSPRAEGRTEQHERSRTCSYIVKKCNNLNTTRHYSLKLARARRKTSIVTLYLSPSSGTTTVHSPSAYFVSIFPCTLLQFLHKTKDILYIQVHILSKEEMVLRDILLLSYRNIKPGKLSQQSHSETIEDESVVWNSSHRQWNWLRVFKCLRINQF